MLVARGSVLRPGLLCIRGLCAGFQRPGIVREPGALRPNLPGGPFLLFTSTRILSASSPGKDAPQIPSDPDSRQASDPADDNKKPNKTKQLKQVFKEYGAVAVSFHVGISLVSLGIFYVIVSSGLDMTSLLLKIGFSEELVQSKLAAGTSTFVLAYAIHKLFAPARISITLVSVPFIVRYLRRIGLFKPPS